MILGKDSRKPWSDMDILLATAYQTLENERCSQCGLYVWICHSEDREMQFEVEEDSCEATRMVAERSKQSSVSKKLEDKPWIKLRPVPTMANQARDFSELRTPYFEQEAKRLGLSPDS